MAAANLNHLDPEHIKGLGKMPTNTLKRHPKNVDLSKAELIKLLSCLEGELQGKDITIATLKAEKAKQLFYQAKYGRFGLGDPFHAMQRDSDCQKDNSFDETAVKAMYDNQLLQLENLIDTQRKAQMRMREQLVAVEKRYHKMCAELDEEKKRHAQDTEEGDNVTCMLEKERERLKQELEFERAQKKKVEKELKKSSTSAAAAAGEDPAVAEKHKHIALMLIADRKKINEQMAKLRARNQQLEQIIKDEQAKTKEMAEALSVEGQKSQRLEASLEKNLSDFDTERAQLKMKLKKEEFKTRELTTENEQMRVTIEELQSQLSSVETASGAGNSNMFFPSRSSDQAGSQGSARTPLDHRHSSPGPATSGVMLQSTDKVLSRHGAATSHLASPSPGSLTTSGRGSPSSPRYVSQKQSNPQSEPRKVPIVHMNDSASGSPLKPSVDANSTVRRAIMQFDTTTSGDASDSSDALQQSLKPKPAEKPAELQSPRVIAGSSAPPTTSASVLTVSSGTTVFTTPSGTRISLNVGPSPMSGAGQAGIPAGSSVGSGGISKRTPVAAPRDTRQPPPVPSKPHGLHSPPTTVNTASPPLPTATRGAPPKADFPFSASPVASPRSGSSATGGAGSIPLPVQHQTTSGGSARYTPPRYGTPAYARGGGGGGGEVAAGDATPAVNATTGRKPHPPQTTNVVQNSAGPSVIGRFETSRDDPVTSTSDQPNLEFLGPEMDDLQQLLVSMATEPDSQSCSSQDSDPLDPSSHPGSQDPSPRPSPSRTGSRPSSAKDSTQSPRHASTPRPHVVAMKQLIRDADWSGLCSLASGLRGAELSEALDHENTAVHYVTQAGQLECLHVLLSLGAEVNARNCDGLTPLHIATGSAFPECCALLLQHGALVNLADKSGQSSLHMAVRGGSADVVQTILDHCVRTSTYRLGELLYAGDREGASALFLAAQRDTVDILSILAKYSDLDAVGLDDKGRTIIDVASPACKSFLKTIEDKPKITCQVVVSNPACSADVSIEPAHYVIGDIPVPMETTWQQLEESLSNRVLAHLHGIATGLRGAGGRGAGAKMTDGEGQLGITLSSIKYFSIGKYFWSPGTASEKLPHELLANTSRGRHVVVTLFGLDDVCLDGLSYESLIPIPHLQNYIRLMEQYRSVLFYGAAATGKTFLCRKLAHVIQAKESDQGRVCEVTCVSVHDRFSHTDLNSLLHRAGCLVPNGQTLNRSFTPVIILDGLHKVRVADVFRDLLPLLDKRGPTHVASIALGNKSTQLMYLHPSCYILGTLDKNRLPVSEASVQQAFRWVHMRIDQEPLRGSLHKHYYRALMSQHGGNASELEEETEQTVAWVAGVWTRLNEGLHKLGLSEQALGPSLFLTCPIRYNDTQAIFKWLQELWNSHIAPAVSQAVLQSSANSGNSSATSGNSSATSGNSSVTSGNSLSNSGNNSAGVGNSSAGVGNNSAVSGTDSRVVGNESEDRRHKMASTALYVLMQRAVVSGCPLTGHEKDKYLSAFAGSNELDIKIQRKAPSSNSANHSGVSANDSGVSANHSGVSATYSGVPVDRPIPLSTSRSGTLGRPSSESRDSSDVTTQSRDVMSPGGAALQQSRSLGSVPALTGQQPVTETGLTGQKPGQTGDRKLVTSNSQKMIPINPVAPSQRRTLTLDSPKSFGSSMFAISGIPSRGETTNGNLPPPGGATASSGVPNQDSVATPKPQFRATSGSPRSVGSPASITSSQFSRSLLASSPLPPSAASDATPKGPGSIPSPLARRDLAFSLPQASSAGTVPLGTAGIGGEGSSSNANDSDGGGGFNRSAYGVYSTPVTSLGADMASGSGLPQPDTSVASRTGVTGVPGITGVTDVTGVASVTGVTGVTRTWATGAVRATQDTASLRRAFSPTPATPASGTRSPAIGSGFESSSLPRNSASQYRRAFSPSPEKPGPSTLSLPRKT